MPEKLVPPPEAEGASQAAALEVRQAAEVSKDIHEFQHELRQRVSIATTTDDGDEIYSESGTSFTSPSEKFRAAYTAELEKQSEEVAEATRGFEGVRLETFGGGKMGENLVGGTQSTAAVDRQLVETPIELRRTLIHEADEEEGHSSQAIPETVTSEVALSIRGQYISVTTALEGDVERGTAEKMGEGPQSHRDGQPTEVYGEGQDAVNVAVGLIGEEEWKAHLKRHGEHAGDFQHLQQVIWEAEIAETRKSTEEILIEAEATGYSKAAEQALSSTQEDAGTEFTAVY